MKNLNRFTLALTFLVVSPIGITAPGDPDLSKTLPRLDMGSAFKDVMFGQVARDIEVVGPFADNIRLRTATKTPVLARISIAKRYAQSGCYRLEARIIAPEAKAKTPTGTEILRMTFGINLCRDGNPPKSLEEIS